MPPEVPVTEADFLAFVDGELALERRLEVEEHLAAAPETAARVMADLAHRDALRALARLDPPKAGPRLKAAAAALEDAFLRRRFRRTTRKMAAAAALVALGWIGHNAYWANGGAITGDTPPAFVEDAVHAYRTAVLRAGISSQPHATHFDRGELAAGTGIRLPEFPPDWSVRDVQVFPTREGPSIEMTLDTARHDTLFLFAGTSGRFDVIAPSITATDAGQTVYWQVGHTVYALSGSLPERVIRREAVLLAANFR